MEQLTDEQKQIVETEHDILTVTAYAGTGKTSALRAFAKARLEEKMLYLVFNRGMSQAAKKAFADCPNVEIATFHALAWRHRPCEIKSSVGYVPPQALRDHLRKFDMPDDFRAVGLLHNVLTAFMMSADAVAGQTVEKLPLRRRKELSDNGLDPGKLSQIAEKLWENLLDNPEHVPHNAYLKLYQLNPVQLSCNWILVDEAQDISDCMIDILVKADKKMVLVGDPYQQIYAWNGAVNALEKVGRMGASGYYLTKSFRCTAQVASLANKYLQTLSAPKRYTGTQKPLDAKGKPAILARTNMGLFDFLAQCMSEKKAIYFNGGFDNYDFNALIDIYHLKANKKSKIKNHFLRHMKDYAEFTQYIMMTDDVRYRAKMSIVEKYDDEIPMLYAKLVRSKRNDPRAADLIVSTGHKAKGMEFSMVHIHNDFINLREKMLRATRHAQKGPPVCLSAEEVHLLYMAITRSRGEVAYPEDFNISAKDVETFRNLVNNGNIELA
ncbi:MAG: AAA family ATPase [Desulfovibrio sp.]|nr:AAA family ATPase [Desulfovibrio sp.]